MKLSKLFFLTSAVLFLGHASASVPAPNTAMPNFFVPGPSPSQFAQHSVGAFSDKKLGAGNIDPTALSTIFGYTPQSGSGDYLITIVFFTQSSSCENNTQTQGQLINPTAYNAPEKPSSFTADQASKSWYLSGAGLYNIAQNHLTYGSLSDVSQVQCVKLYDGFKSVAGDAVPVACDNTAKTCTRTTTGTASMLNVYSNTASHP